MSTEPQPQVDPDSAPYWAALKDNRLILKNCLSCGLSHFYPRSICPHCHSDNLDWIESPGVGEIYSFTIARRPAGPHFTEKVPYCIAIVQLNEGPRLMTHLITKYPDDIRIGLNVKVHFDRMYTDFTMPVFYLASEKAPT